MKRPPRRDWFGLDRFQPGPLRAAPEGVCYLLETVGSTNDFLLSRGNGAVGRICRWDGWGWQAEPQARLAPPDAPPAGAVAIARRQAHGRGRMGRTWLSTDGLMLSWLVPAFPARAVTGLAVWTGVIVALVLQEEFGVPAGLQWPNDLMAGTRKLGGVLLDAARTGRGRRLIAGLGLNVGVTAGGLPASLRGRATSIRMATGRNPRLGSLAGAVLARFDAELPRFREEGWDPYAEALDACDALRGRRVVLETARGEVAGVALGIDGSGALRLRREDGRETKLHAGNVRVRGTAAPAGAGEAGRGARADR